MNEFQSQMPKNFTSMQPNRYALHSSEQDRTGTRSIQCSQTCRSKGKRLFIFGISTPLYAPSARRQLPHTTVGATDTLAAGRAAWRSSAAVAWDRQRGAKGLVNQ